MNLRFNFEKSLQAAGVLLRLDGKRMERVRLLKLLYIADRELLAETGRTITGDTGYAMKYGPVLTNIYDLIKGGGWRFEEWRSHIRSEGHAVELEKDPGQGQLSPIEVEKLAEVTRRYQERDDFDLCDLTHEFQEWREHYSDGETKRIPWEDVLRAQHKEELIEAVRSEEEQARNLDALFGG